MLFAHAELLQHRNFTLRVVCGSQMKRYLILTYTVEFDRVHYPLPLAYEEDPNPAALKATIRRLRQELESTRSGLSEPIEPREKELRQIITQLRQENTQLRHRLRQLESRQKRDEESGVRESPNALRKQYEVRTGRRI